MEKIQVQGIRNLAEETVAVWGRYAIYVRRDGRKICKMFGLSKDMADRFTSYYKDAVVEEMY